MSSTFEMADSIREKILQNVKTNLEEITGIEKVIRGAVNPFEMNPLPAISILEVSEDLIEPYFYPYASWELILSLRLWLSTELYRSEKLNGFLAEIKNKMHEDNTRGGNAIDTLATNITNTYLDAQGAVEAGADLAFRITYRTLLKDAYSAS